MRVNKWLATGSGIVLGGMAVCAVLMAVSHIGVASANFAPAGPGLAVSPGYSVDVDPGDVVDYVHIISNTGDVDAFYGLQASTSERWAVDYFNAMYPDGTTALLPLPLQAGAAMTVGVRVSVPATATGGTVNTTTVTVTLLYEGVPQGQVVVYDRAAVKEEPRPSWSIYLPLALRNYAPPLDDDFSAGLGAWTKWGVLGVSVASDPSNAGNPVALLGNLRYACWNGVPIGYAGISRRFYVPSAPVGQSVYLRFRYRIYSNDRNTELNDAYDAFEVYVDDVLRFRDANQVEFDACNVQPYDLGWRNAYIDLGAGGSEMILALEVYNRYDRFYNTYVYIDDIRIVVQ